MSGLTRAAWLALPLLCLSAAPHPDSLSTSRIEVASDRLDVTLRCQVLSYLEVLPEVDENGDGRFSTDEVARHGGELIAYAVDHYRIGTDTGRDLEVGRWLELDGVGVTLVDQDELEPGGVGFRAGAVELSFEGQFTRFGNLAKAWQNGPREDEY